jgi:serine protease Do
MHIFGKPVRWWLILALFCATVSGLSTLLLYQLWLRPQYETFTYQGPELLNKPVHLPTSPVGTAAEWFATAAERVRPAVVSVRATSGGWLDELAVPSYSRSISSGSGVLISPDGLLVTNYHVIANQRRLLVTLNDKREFKASLVGADPATDLALLRIESRQPLPFLRMSDSDSLRVGEWVLAVGNPFHLESTVTAGIVSAKGRSIDVLEDQDRIESFIQTDAVVNPGNSGGALVNTRGELVGINTAILTRTGHYEGYSFAIPVNLVRKVVRDLRDHGQVQRGLLGVFVEPVTASLAQQLRLSQVGGVIVTRVTPGGGAEAAGLAVGDVLLEIDKKAVTELPLMQELLASKRPGARIQIKYLRDGRIRQAQVVLSAKAESQRSPLASLTLNEPGFELRDLSNDEKRKLGTRGAKVITVFRNSTIAKINMEPGFIITAVNEEDIRSARDLAGRLPDLKGKIMLEGVYEGYQGKYYYVYYRD